MRLWIAYVTGCKVHDRKSYAEHNLSIFFSCV